jgi:Ca-activated chloride channel homolog
MRPEGLPRPSGRDASMPVLQQVDYRVRLVDLLAEVRVVQVYRNAEETNIEAVFTFPMPVEATLLELEVEIGDRKLTGVVVERSQGQEQYEDAVADGDTAVLLEEVQPGLFTLNAGNLLSGETARIALRYAQLFHWQGSSFRFFLPTTVAPRYGDPGAAGLAPHQIPPVGLLVENACRIEVEASGGLIQGEFDSPSHKIEIERSDEVTRVSLREDRTWMDRDFVLNVTCPEGDRTFAVREESEEGSVLWASFHPIWDWEEDPSPRSLKIVVDCSGSMAGDSIVQACGALAQILDELRPQDYFNLVRFGSSAEALFRRQVKANPRNVQAARRLLGEMDADMSGTEIGPALEMAYASRALEGISSDLLLITDGEVWHVDPVLETAASSEHRVFTVGVGSAVSEGFLRTLARRTGGACELVTPNEQMAERIVRHFRRIGSPKIQDVRIRWSAARVEKVPARIESVYRDETLHVFALCDRATGEDVVLELGLGEGCPLCFQAAVHTVPWDVESPSLLARLAVARRLREEKMEAEEATKLAVRYQLVTSHTCVLVVAQREEAEKAEDLPALRQVPHMLAAGWGGMGTTQDMAAAPPLMESQPRFMRKAFRQEPPDSPRGILLEEAALYEPEGKEWGSFVENLCRWLGNGQKIAGIDDLAALGLRDDILDRLEDLATEEHGEEILATVFLLIVVQRLPQGMLDRSTIRSIRRDYRQQTRGGDWDGIVQVIEEWVREIPGLQ